MKGKVNMIKLAYSTNGFTERTLDQAIEVIAKCQYQGIEILADRPHYHPQNAMDPSKLASLLSSYQLQVSNINANTAMFVWPEWMPETIFEPSLSHPNLEIRKQRIQIVKEIIDWASTFKAKTISVTSGRSIGKEGILRHEACFIESLFELCAYAKQKNCQISVEYEPGFLIENAQDVLRMIKALEPYSLKVNLDLGHAQCAYEDPIQSMCLLTPYIANFHIEDIKDRKHYHLVPGDGNMPFQAIFDAMYQIQYDGFVTVELYQHAHQDEWAASRAIQYLKPFLKT